MITDKIEKNKFLLIAGPCAIEGRDIAFGIAERLVDITSKLSIPLVYKGSYRKANRTRLDSFTGIGDIEALKILADIGSRFDVPVITDIHSSSEAKMAAEYVDIIQIPAFLARQTDILVSAAATNKIINIKKGQFISPKGIHGIISKVGEENVWITERGSSFGYDKMIIDFEGIQYIKDSYNVPIFLDITHSVSERKYSKTMARLAGALGLNLFVEVHDNPDEAPSDGKKMININEFEKLIKTYII